MGVSKMKYRLQTTKDTIGRPIFYTIRNNGRNFYKAKADNGQERWVDEEWVIKNHQDIINIEKMGRRLTPKNIQEDLVLASLNKVAKVYVTLNKDKFLDVEVSLDKCHMIIRKANCECNFPLYIGGLYNQYDVLRLVDILYKNISSLDLEVELALGMGIYGSRIHDILKDSNSDDDLADKVRETYKSLKGYQKYLLQRIEEMKKVIQNNREYFIDSYADRITQKYGEIGLKQLEEQGYLRFVD